MYRLAVPPRAVSPLLLIPLAVLLALVVTNLFTTSFEKLGLARPLVGVVLVGSLAGSLVNIPLWARRTESSMGRMYRLGHWLYYQPPRIERQIVAVNVGGAIIPFVLSVWLLAQAPLWKLGLAVVLMALITNRFARIVPNHGISMPVLLPPFAAGAIATLLAQGGSTEAAAIAYVGGSMGTLIGADILNLPRLSEVGPGVVSIGGAGLFDGVFLVGLVAALLAG
jgi:uncharacterized membrane protein